ncbi:MAG: 4-alpha-glucanotransferase [Hymenobacter sp.]
MASAQQVCVLGSDPALGSWDNTRPLVLSDAAYPTWQAELALQSPEAELRYKYGLWDAAQQTVTELEVGDDRVLPAGTAAPDILAVLHDEGFRYAAGPWRGAGVALPVFSLRSEKGLGVGEFTDLKLLMDWAVTTGLNLVQILPINDTTATHTWVDSYPYAAISVFALHPLYLSLDGIAELKGKAAARRAGPLARGAERQGLRGLRGRNECQVEVCQAALSAGEKEISGRPGIQAIQARASPLAAVLRGLFGAARALRHG